MRSLISLFILSRRGRSLLVNTPLVARARLESLRTSGGQPCWPLHAVVHTSEQDFASCSSRWSKILVVDIFSIMMARTALAMDAAEDWWEILSCLHLLVINEHC